MSLFSSDKKKSMLALSMDIMQKIIIIGHKNPDTDSIVSAIGAQEYCTKALGLQATAMRAGELNNETKFVLDYFNIDEPELVEQIEQDTRVVLVDHNEKTQTLDGLDYNQVKYIFDHHKLSIATENPIFVHCEPIGSTSSLIAKLIFEKNISPSDDVAKLLIAGILSDTLNLTSPTTTDEDKKLVERLNNIAKLDLADFVSQMFKAKSSLEGISVDQIISLDYKTFEMGTKQVGVGTWETTFPEGVNEKKEEIKQALIAKKEAEKLDLIFFMVVDILEQNCQLYLISDQEKEIAQVVFGGDIENGMMFLPEVVSRKKQIIPQLTEELSK